MALSMTPLEFAKKYLDLEAYMYPLETGEEADSPGPGNVPEGPGIGYSVKEAMIASLATRNESISLIS